MKIDFTTKTNKRGRKTIVPTVNGEPIDDVVFSEVECELDCTFLTIRVAMLDAAADEPSQAEEDECL